MGGWGWADGEGRRRASGSTSHQNRGIKRNNPFRAAMVRQSGPVRKDAASAVDRSSARRRGAERRGERACCEREREWETQGEQTAAERLAERAFTAETSQWSLTASNPLWAAAASLRRVTQGSAAGMIKASGVSEV